jgi:hypothetical protein
MILRARVLRRNKIKINSVEEMRLNIRTAAGEAYGIDVQEK